MKNIQLTDVLHLLIGQKVLENWFGTKKIVTVKGVIGTSVIYSTDEDGNPTDSTDFSEKTQSDKFLFRPFSDMTKKEAKCILKNYGFKGIEMQMDEVLFAIKIVNRISEHGWLFNYLLKQRFDVFGLIESGQALDETKI